MQKIEIALAANEPYFCGMLVTACSIAKYAQKECALSYTILDGGIGEGNRRYLEERLKHFHPDTVIRYLEVNDELFAAYPDWHGNKMAYARLMLPTALPEVDWIVYCDVDFLWLRDIAELWELREDQRAFIGVQDLHRGTRLSEKAWFEARGYPFDMDNYFCSGLCFMNLRAFREEGLVGKIKEVLDKHHDIQFPDQAALNIVTWGRRKLVDGRWQRFVANLTREDVQAGVVIHHAGQIPWKPLVRLIHPLNDAMMLWHHLHAEIRGISTWQALRLYFSPLDILLHRGFFWLMQFPCLKPLVRFLCRVGGHPSVWTCLEPNVRRLGKR